MAQEGQDNVLEEQRAVDHMLLLFGKSKIDIQAIEGTDKLATLVEQMRAIGVMARSVGETAQEELMARFKAAEETAKRARVEMEVEVDTLSTKFKSTVPDTTIRFSVRGTPFATSTSNLLEGAERTYFSVLAQGRFKIVLDKDGAIFIDRSVFGFQVVWNYILGDVVNLGTLSEAELEIVREEADFYQIHSLLKLLAPPLLQFSSDFVGPEVSFSSSNTVVTRVGETDDNNYGGTSYIMSSAPFVIPQDADFAEMRVKLLSPVGQFTVSFGLAPAYVMRNPDFFFGNCFGYHVTTHMELLGATVLVDDDFEEEPVEFNGFQFHDGFVGKDSVLQLRLHRNKTISYVLDGEDLGVAFRHVTSEPLYLVVSMTCEGDCIELV
jgi:hypothetical protein